jgi:hypothetical protein
MEHRNLLKRGGERENNGGDKPNQCALYVYIKMGTLWHLQKFLQCTKFIILEFFFIPPESTIYELGNRSSLDTRTAFTLILDFPASK